MLNDSSENRVKEIVTGLAATNPEPGTVAFKVSTIYNQAMDSVRRNNEGAEPIKADLARIEAAPADSMTDLFLWIHTNYSSPFFGGGPMENMANSNEYAMYIGGGSMGLPDRDYYLADDERNTSVREAYKKLILARARQCRLRRSHSFAHHEHRDEDRDRAGQGCQDPRREPQHPGHV